MKNIIDEKLHRAGEGGKIKNLPGNPPDLVEVLRKSVKRVGEVVRKKRKPNP